MKKTLVFYTGRAPKGKRTNWVMHEYRTTLDELDGTKPGQGAFVLCRLFKKLDESIEGSNCDNAEPSVSNPTAVQSSPDEMQSELASTELSPELEKQDLNHPTKIETTTPESNSETPAALDYNCNDEDQLTGATNMQEDLQLEEDLKFFIDSPTESNKVFLPLHSHVQAEFEPAYMSYASGNDFSKSDPRGTNESEDLISTFLDSVLNNSDDFSYDDSNYWMQSTDKKNTGPFNDNGSCSGSEPEVGQPLVLETVHELSDSLWFDELDFKFPQERETTLFSNKNVDDDPSSGSVLDEVSTWFNGDEESSKPVINNALDSSNDIGTGIKIKRRQPKDQTQQKISSMQGDATRRIRLRVVKSEDYSCEQEPNNLEPTHMNELHDCDICASVSDGRMLQVMKKSIGPKKKLNNYCWWGKKISFGSSKASSTVRRSPAVLMFRVAIIAVLFALFVVGAWRCLSIDAAARTYQSKRAIHR
jgi:hypothetical protein